MAVGDTRGKFYHQEDQIFVASRVSCALDVPILCKPECQNCYPRCMLDAHPSVASCMFAAARVLDDIINLSNHPILDVSYHPLVNDVINFISNHLILYHPLLDDVINFKQSSNFECFVPSAIG